MPADFETGFFGSTATGERWSAWHGLGTTIDRPYVDTAEAITLAGLDWTVDSVPVEIQLPDGSVARSPRGELAQVRSDTKDILGFVSTGYHNVDNLDRFRFMDELLDQARIHTAGVLRGGRQVWALAQLTDQFRLGGSDDELINWYLLLTDGTAGEMSLTLAPTPVRVVCTNTCRFALQSAPRVWRGRHTRSLEGRMAEAATTIGLTRRYIKAFETEATSLVNAKLSKVAFTAFLDRLVPLPTKKAEGADRSWTNANERREAITAVYQTADNLANVRGTKWGALQAVGEYVDWGTDPASPAPNAERQRIRDEAAWSRRLSTSDLKDAAHKILVAA